jgi:hypothetical protein
MNVLTNLSTEEQKSLIHLIKNKKASQMVDGQELTEQMMD